MKNTAPGASDQTRRVISKEEINRLPLKSFPGVIHLINAEKSLPDLTAGLPSRLEGEVIGMDTESRPSFRKGEKHPICLVQLATREEAFLFQVRQGEFPLELRQIIEHPGILKIVQGAAQELQDLFRDHGVRGAAFFDLPGAAKECGCSPRSLRGLTAIFLGIRVSKSAQRSNWEQSRLSVRQLQYAATDAWAPLMIYDKMRRAGLIDGRVKTLTYTEPEPGKSARRRSRRRSPRPRGDQAPPAART